ncbi:MAG: hypothetical protein KC933_16095 [Myxococcales bacterium]|nr:hypothetical protein [Myxococcales bacterium]
MPDPLGRSQGPSAHCTAPQRAPVRPDPAPGVVGPFPAGLDRLDPRGFVGLERPLPRPPGGVPLPLPDHRDHAFRTFAGPLFAGRIEARAVEQGAVADCFIAAALASIAHTRPKAVREVFEELTPKDGHRRFEVTLFEPDGAPRAWPVNDELLVDDTGRPIYGRWPAEGPEELWFPLLEKAFMDLLNEREGVDQGYLAGARGGSAFVVFEALLGAVPRNYSLAQHAHRPDAVADLIREAAAKREPMVAYTYDKAKAHLYEGTGLIPWHTYSVLGVQDVDGVPHVELYNPWARGEPGGDGEDDGFFTLPMQDFLRLYRNMNIGHDPQR